MNKLFTKIATLALGSTMAIGVGVAAGQNNQSIRPAHAADSGLTPTSGQFIIDFYDSTKLSSTSGTGLTSSNYSNFVKVPTGLTATSVVTGVSVTGTVQYGKNGGLTAGTGTASASSSHYVTFSIGSSYAVNKCTVYATSYESGRWKLNDNLPDSGSFGSKGATFANVTSPLVWDELGGVTSLTFKKESTSGGTQKRLTIYTIVCEFGSVQKYTVSFNSNGGSGSMSNVTDVSGNYTLPANGFTAPSGKAFSGWKADNAGNLIAAGGSYTVSANVTFYAQWVDAYTVTYNAGTNGTGSYAHALQPTGTYTLLPFASLTGVAASTGYKFNNYTVGGVDKDPGDTITLSAATTVTVNFVVKPAETTYDFTANFATYASSWSNSYGTHEGVDGVDDVGGDYAATIDFYKASKQTGTITTMPVFATKTASGSWYKVLQFTLNESGYKIKEVEVTFAQWGSKTPDVALFKGASASGTALDTATIGTTNTVSTSDLNDTIFSIGYCDKNTSSNVQAGISSIYITIEATSSFGTLDHITVTSLPDTVIYHSGETYDPTGFIVMAYDGVDEATANFKDVTASVSQTLSDSYVFSDNDVPGIDEEVQYTENSVTVSTTYHVTVYALAEYELVTAAPDDWSGNYLIVGTTKTSELGAFNGALSNPDDEKDYKVVTEKSTGVIEAGQELEWTIAVSGDGYSIQGKSGKYIGSLTSKSNGMLVSDSAVENTLSYDSENSATIITGTNTYCLQLNTTGDRFRYYASGTVQLYKLVESSDVSDYADMFLQELQGGEDPICQADGDTVLADLKASWKTLAETFDLLSNADKEEFRLGVASESASATNVAKALALYDYVAVKYNTQLQQTGLTNYNFMGRTLQSGAKPAISVVTNNSGSIILVTMSFIALASVGGYFFLRKKKEN